MVEPQQRQILSLVGWSLAAIFVVVALDGLWFGIYKQAPDRWMWLFTSIYWLTYLAPMAILAAAVAVWGRAGSWWRPTGWFLIGLAAGLGWQFGINVAGHYFLGVLVYHDPTSWWASSKPVFLAPELYVSSLIMFLVTIGVLKLSWMPIETARLNQPQKDQGDVKNSSA